MKKLLRIMLLTGLLSAVSVTTVFASEPERTDGFVCPVLGGEAGGENGQSSPDVFITIADGDTSILGPDVSVPVHATNDNGAGSPGGDHASPGDPGYTAIWDN